MISLQQKKFKERLRSVTKRYVLMQKGGQEKEIQKKEL